MCEVLNQSFDDPFLTALFVLFFLPSQPAAKPGTKRHYLSCN